MPVLLIIWPFHPKLGHYLWISTQSYFLLTLFHTLQMYHLKTRPREHSCFLTVVQGYEAAPVLFRLLPSNCAHLAANQAQLCSSSVNCVLVILHAAIDQCWGRGGMPASSSKWLKTRRINHLTAGTRAVSSAGPGLSGQGQCGHGLSKTTWILSWGGRGLVCNTGVENGTPISPL